MSDEIPTAPESGAETSEAGLVPTVVAEPDDGQLKHFVSAIKSAEHQVGEHIIQALRDPETVAVITTVGVGPDGVQRIVSAALDPERLHDVQALLAQSAERRTEDVPCIGFHCYLRRNEDEQDATEEPDDASS